MQTACPTKQKVYCKTSWRRTGTRERDEHNLNFIIIQSNLENYKSHSLTELSITNHSFIASSIIGRITKENINARGKESKSDRTRTRPFPTIKTRQSITSTPTDNHTPVNKYPVDIVIFFITFTVNHSYSLTQGTAFCVIKRVSEWNCQCSLYILNLAEVVKLKIQEKSEWLLHFDSYQTNKSNLGCRMEIHSLIISFICRWKNWMNPAAPWNLTTVNAILLNTMYFSIHPVHHILVVVQCTTLICVNTRMPLCPWPTVLLQDAVNRVHKCTLASCRLQQWLREIHLKLNFSFLTYEHVYVFPAAMCFQYSSFHLPVNLIAEFVR